MTLQVLRTIEQMRHFRHTHRGRLGFVPTMGALHSGHLNLVQAAKKQSERVVVSIFVNPSQFNNPEDLKLYPRDLEKDVRLLEEVGADAVFAPEVGEIYPPGFALALEPAYPFLQRWEGEHRPGHFRGVATVVLKLFSIVQADVAFFGLKDYQQCLLIQKMVADLSLPLEIVLLPTVREADGLAMSSRNQRLSPETRALAARLPQTFQRIEELILKQGALDLEALRATFTSLLAEEGEVEYLAFVEPSTLEPQAQFQGRTLLIVAWKLGGVRLIDNVLIQT